MACFAFSMAFEEFASLDYPWNILSEWFMALQTKQCCDVDCRPFIAFVLYYLNPDPNDFILEHEKLT